MLAASIYKLEEKNLKFHSARYACLVENAIIFDNSAKEWVCGLF